MWGWEVDLNVSVFTELVSSKVAENLLYCRLWTQTLWAETPQINIRPGELCTLQWIEIMLNTICMPFVFRKQCSGYEKHSHNFRGVLFFPLYCLILKDIAPLSFWRKVWALCASQWRKKEWERSLRRVLLCNLPLKALVFFHLSVDLPSIVGNCHCILWDLLWSYLW